MYSAGGNVWRLSGYLVARSVDTACEIPSLYTDTALVCSTTMVASYHAPAHSDQIRVSFPQEHVMLLTFNRPKALNAITPTMTSDVKRILDWFDQEPSLW